MEKVKKEIEPVDLVMLNYNGLEFTKPCIESLFKHTKYPFRLTILDNASKDGSVDYLNALEKSKKNVKVIYNEKPDSGAAEGYNTALRTCKAEIIGLIGNDLLFFQDDWLDKMVETLTSQPLIALVGCKLLYPNGTIQHAGTYIMPSFMRKEWQNAIVWEHIGRFQDSTKYSKTREIGGVTFACILAKREPFGLLDDGYKIGMYDDNDKCCELRSKGFKTYYRGDVSVYHYELATLGSRDPKVLNDARIMNFGRFTSKWGEWLMRDAMANQKLYQIVEDRDV